MEIIFEKEFKQAPIVNVSGIWNLDSATSSVADQIDGFFVSSEKFAIANLTTKGFYIILDNKAVSDLKFSWIAIPCQRRQNL